MLLDSFPDLSSYIGYVQSNFPNGGDFPLKIMGKKKPAKGTNKEVYYSSALLAEAYRDIPNPDDIGTTPVDTHFGQIGKYNSILDPVKIYSVIRKDDKGNDAILQGDIVQMDLKVGFKITKVMILSHSCTTANSANILCCPVLDESEIDQPFVDFYKGQPGGNLNAIKGNLVDNLNVNFVGLPAISQGANSQKMISGICYPFFIPREAFKGKIASFRLTYRGLAYLQQRLALFYFRDVQDSDDCRDM